jgi:hypothetical protein
MTALLEKVLKLNIEQRFKDAIRGLLPIPMNPRVEVVQNEVGVSLRATEPRENLMGHSDEALNSFRWDLARRPSI